MRIDETPASLCAQNGDISATDGPAGAPILYDYRAERLRLVIQAVNAPHKDNPVIQAVAAGVERDLQKENR